MYGLLLLPLMILGSVCFFRNRNETYLYQLLLLGPFPLVATR